MRESAVVSCNLPIIGDTNHNLLPDVMRTHANSKLYPALVMVLSEVKRIKAVEAPTLT